VYVRGHQVVKYDASDPLLINYQKRIGDDPDGNEHPEMLRIKVKNKPDHHLGTINDGISRIGWMSGGNAARWKDEEMSDILTAEAEKFIKDNKDRPFFLYFAPQQVHEPHVAAKRFQGTSQCGVYGDVLQELDWTVGEIMRTLDELKLAENTLLIFSSDNGAALRLGESYVYDDGGRDPLSHRRNGALRGGKGDPWEGGTREPFIVRWPAGIKPGRTSSEIISLVDLPATCAALAGQTLPSGAAPDSVNVAAALLGTGPGRNFVVEQHFRGAGGLAIRQGPWKLIPTQGGAELYSLADDVGEARNIAAGHPEKVQELTDLLQRVRKGDKVK
jgi:arylsulfatase A-like enzyme